MDRFRKFKGAIAFITVIIGFLSCSDKKKEVTEVSFNLPEKSECIGIINADSLSDGTRYMFREFVGGHPVLVINNILTVLDDSLIEPIPLPFDHLISDIHWKDGLCFFSSDSIIYYGEDNGESHPLVVADNQISSFVPTDDKVIFLLDSLIASYSYGANEIELLHNAHKHIQDMDVDQESVIFATDSALFILNEQKTYRIYSANAEITSFALYKEGIIFFSTTESIYCIDPQYWLVQIVNKPARSLTAIGDTMYIIFEDNNSVMLMNLYGFIKNDSNITDNEK